MFDSSDFLDAFVPAMLWTEFPAQIRCSAVDLKWARSIDHLPDVSTDLSLNRHDVAGVGRSTRLGSRYACKT